MPSQISLRTSTVLSGSVDQRSIPSDNAMQAAAGKVATLLTAAHSSSRKPHIMVSSPILNSCAELGISPTTVESSLSNGSTSPFIKKLNMAHNHTLDRNGIVRTPPAAIPFTAGPAKTEGAHSSNEESSLTGLCNSSRLMCPELALSYTGSLITKRAAHLTSKQKMLEKQVSSLQRKVRQRQLRVVDSHVRKQLHFLEDTERDALTADESESSVSELPHRTESIMPLPIQVDGASDDTFISPNEEMNRTGGDGRVRGEDSFSSMESYVSNVPSDAEGGVVQTMTAQLSALEGLLDDDLTDASSDEEDEEGEDQDDMEEEESADHMQRHSDVKGSWECSRLSLGSRWSWLQRRIADLNKQIYRLDHHIKETVTKEKLEFLAPNQSATLPQYFSITNGTVLESIRGNNGSDCLFAVGTKPGNNGFSHHHSSGHAPYLPHLLLPEALLGAKLQVKDLLSPSPLGRNLLYLEETNSTAARTRPLVRRVNRKIVRRKITGRVRSSLSVDSAFHPQLSMAHELPSRLTLDSGVKQILSEHSYAQLPLNKRRKAASTLAQLSTPHHSSSYQGYEHSPSPSPMHTPVSLESTRGDPSRRKPSFLQHQTSLDSTGSSVWSPGLSHPTTPSNITPLHSTRKRRMASSTPLFDIDNIVIPYSIAASTRLEKLEYKEIMTPSWREVEACPPAEHETQKDSNSKHHSLEEDLSDAAFINRHARCELTEKKRFLNFISGGQRKRSRPQSATTLSISDSPSLSSPPPPRRLTIASPSPTPNETELATLLHPAVLPWQPRVFPLVGKDLEELEHPPPPPPLLHPSQPSSPRCFRTSTPSQTPSCTSSTHATPLPSPLSTPSEETPVVSPAEWVVNNHFSSTTGLLSYRAAAGPADSSLPSPVGHNPIILKLTKKL